MSDRVESPRRWYQRPRIIVPLALLAFFILGMIVWESLCRARLNRAIADTRKVEPLLTFEEILASRPPIPDDQNGMRVIERVAGELDTIQANKDGSLDSLPVIGDAETPPLGRRVDEQTLAAVDARLDELAVVMKQIDRLAEYDDGRYTLVVSPNPVDTLLPHLSRLRTASKLERLDLLRHSQAGDTAAVLEDLRAMSTVGRLVDDEPTLISALVSVATDALCIEASQAALARCEFSPEQLARLDDILARLRSPRRLYDGMRGERAFFVGMSEAVQSNPSAISAFTSGGLPPFYTRLPGLRGLFRCDVAYGLDYYTQMLQAIQNGTVDRESLNDLEQYASGAPRQFVFSRITLPPLTRALELDARQTAMLDAAGVGVALERCRLDHGDWPPELDALVPAYLDAVPIDPFSGEPLKYVVGDQGVVVYSVDENRRDDGGDVEPFRTTKEKRQADAGFVLLNPDQRNRPPAPDTQPQPGEQ